MSEEIKNHEFLKDKKDLTLLAAIGIPDICVVLEEGEVAATFYRNCTEEPVLEVLDLDYIVENPLSKEERMQAQDSLDTEMKERGFKFMPHFVADNEVDPEN